MQHTLVQLTVATLLSSPAVLANPLRRHHGILHMPLATRLVFWQDQECTVSNGQIRWSEAMNDGKHNFNIFVVPSPSAVPRLAHSLT
jgi:hypothetical protein